MIRSSVKRLTHTLLTFSCMLSTTIHATTPYLWVDYLLWKAQEDQLEYAGVANAFVNPMSPSFGKTTYEAALAEQPSRWSSGVRAGIGCTFRETWDASLAYTHFRQRTCTSVRTGNNDVASHSDINVDHPTVALFSLSGLDQGFYFGNSALSRWQINLDTVDADVGKVYNTFTCFSLNPYVSIKWARINQCQTITSGAIVDITQVFAPPLGSSRMQRTNNFSGIGPRIGIAASWLLGHHFSLISDASGAFLTGKTAVRTNAQITSSADNPLNPGVIILDCKRNTRLALQLLLGVEYEWCVCDRVTLALHVGYEAQYWPTQWHLPTSVQILGLPSNGDLALHGFTFGLAGRF